MSLALPLVVLVCLGIADIGRAFSYSEAVSNADREAARLAALESPQTAGNAACSGTSSPTSASLTSHLPWQSGDPTAMTTIANGTALESSSDGTTSGTQISGALLTITWHCSSGAPVTNSTDTSEDPSQLGSAAITAQITYHLTLITPLISRIVGASPAIAAHVTIRAAY